MSRRSAHLPPPKLWRPLMVALAVFLGIGCVMLWNWHILGQREQRETKRRFELDVQSVGHLVRTRMKAYEMVLRGISSTFAGRNAPLSSAQWDAAMKQLRVQELYPGISSVVWSRYLRPEMLDVFLARTQADTQADYHIFPMGRRAQYLPIEFIEPLNTRTSAVLGLDLLTQSPQSAVVIQAINSGQAMLSMPLPDLYAVSPEPSTRVGALMYFPVYSTGVPPDTVDARRATFLGMTNAAFSGYELAEGIFGAQLRLFQISARDIASDLPIFDSRYAQALTLPDDDWQPRFRGQTELVLYGRTWRLDVSSTPEYENAMVLGSHDLVLVIGLPLALFLALLAGGFMALRDRQLYASHRVAGRLREQARQLMIANRYKSEFLANMSHELRTPLNSILILSDQLRQNNAGNLSEKQTRHAEIVHRAGTDLLQLINDVLDLAKIEAGRMQINMEPLNLQDMLIDLDASMRPQAEAKNLHLYIPPVTSDNDAAQRVYTDRVRLHQILRNLLSNAIKFTDHGQVHLAVHVGERRADGTVLVRFAVRDTGIGIAASQHEQVFEAFAQLDGSTRRRYGGTGLGLPITRQLVQALDGDISLESAPGQGSTFTVTLPMRSIAALTPAEAKPPARAGHGQALLIVEDDVNFAAVVTEKAHAHGFSSVHCTTGQQALELLQHETFVAVVLDILLPDISGWQLFRRLRTLPAYQHTPVHIISCLPQPVGLEEENGTHYLSKPIGNNTLEQLFANLKDGACTQGTTLLLVEDVEAEREHYHQQLAALGFVVSTCENAQQACATWEEKPFDVLVIDLNLPDQDGFTLLKKLDTLRSLQGTRVVINTGVDLTRGGLQRLRDYSAVVVRKEGQDTHMLEQAVQGFLVGISSTNTHHEASATPPEVVSLTPGLQAGGLQGRRLLLVDDDIRNVYAMSAMLDEFGLDVSTASNGEEAIACFLQAPVDVILMDMSMPVMDGYTATNLLKTQHGCMVPIIALTAHAMVGDREKCLAAGADDYMAKPVEADKLRALLEQWLAASDSAGN